MYIFDTNLVNLISLIVKGNNLLNFNYFIKELTSQKSVNEKVKNLKILYKQSIT